MLLTLLCTELHVPDHWETFWSIAEALPHLEGSAGMGAPALNSRWSGNWTLSTSWPELVLKQGMLVVVS